MGIFTRVRDIVNSNVNAALDKAENPEKLVKHMIHEMEDTLIEIKGACAAAMAGEKKAARDTEAARGRAAQWASRARMAVDKGREDLAREALRAKRRHLNEAERAAEAATDLAEVVDQYKGDIVKVEEKLNAAREHQRILVQRHIHAVQKQKVQREIRRFDSSKAIIRFEEFQYRLDHAEAEVDLVSYGRPKGLEEEFVALERDEDIEEELERLKESRKSGVEVTEAVSA